MEPNCEPRCNDSDEKNVRTAVTMYSRSEVVLLDYVKNDSQLLWSSNRGVHSAIWPGQISAMLSLGSQNNMMLNLRNRGASSL